MTRGEQHQTHTLTDPGDTVMHPTNTIACPLATSWCAEHTTESPDQCVSSPIDVGEQVSVWLVRHDPTSTPLIALDGPPSGAQLTPASAGRLRAALAALEAKASAA